MSHVIPCLLDLLDQQDRDDLKVQLERIMNHKRTSSSEN